MTTATKPVSRRVETRPAAHGVKSRLAVTIHPGGVLSFREDGRRKASAIYLDISQLYVHGVRRKVAARRRERLAARRKKS